MFAVVVAAGCAGCVESGTEEQRAEARKRLQALEADPAAAIELARVRETGSASGIGKPQQAGTSRPVTVTDSYEYSGWEAVSLAQDIEGIVRAAGWRTAAQCQQAPGRYEILGLKDFGPWVGSLEVEIDGSIDDEGALLVTLMAPFPDEGAADADMPPDEPSCLSADGG